MQEDCVQKSTKASKSISFEYADNICTKLFELRKSEVLESRIKFKIQDLIDANNKEWRFIFTQMKNRRSDSEGFRQIYVPKDQILSE